MSNSYGFRLLLLMVSGLTTVSTSAQMPDLAAAQKWASAGIVHYEVTGIFRAAHVQIPADDADQYGDVEERVTLSFDWDKRRNDFVGVPRFENFPAQVTALSGMDKNCPAGEMNGPYEHFDIIAIKSNGKGAAELTGVQKHPDTMVAESCGSGRKLYAAAEKPVSIWIGPPDPAMLAFGPALPPSGGISISPDGKSIITAAQNDGWVWTYTPSVK